MSKDASYEAGGALADASIAMFKKHPKGCSIAILVVIIIALIIFCS